jgi:hypothetical protein
VKTVEEKIYECLGVKYFKKFVVSIGKVKGHGKSKISKGYNYFLYELSTDGIKDFKKSGIRFNSIVHITGLSVCILFIITSTETFPILCSVLFALLNSYCIMLQRYNNIRLNRIYGKMKEREERKGKLEIEKSKNSSEPTYELVYTRSLNKINSSNLNVEDLKNIRDNLLEQQISPSCNATELHEEKESGFQKRIVKK